MFFGLIALFTMNTEFVPSLVMPTVSVISLWPGVGTEDVEEDLTTILEDRFAALPGLTDMSSESREGVSIILLEFAEEMESDAILQSVRNEVDLASGDLPDGLAGKPAVSTWGAADLPVMSFTVSGGRDADALARYLEDEVIPAVYRVEGVGGARSLGVQSREMVIRLDPQAMTAVNVAPLEVLAAVQNRDSSIPAGLVEWSGGSWTFRVSGRFRDIEELENLVVGGSGNRLIRIRDIAEVRPDYQSAEEYVRSDSTNIAVIQVTKRENGDAILISREIRKTLDRLAEESPDAEFRILHDDSDTIALALRTVLSSAVTGILMAVAVIWLFLRSWRWTLIIAISLPTSLVLAFAGMRLAGQTVNVLTMAGLTVSLGMIVDASIVILENIHRTYEENPDPFRAAEKGAERISGAVFASVATSVSVFTPMLFLKGITGNVMKDLSLTLLFCLGASLFAALFLVPPMAYRGMLNAAANQKRKKKSAQNTGRLMKGLENLYHRILERALEIRGAVILAAAAILTASILGAGLMGISFIPAADYGEIFVSLELPPGSTLEEGTRISDRAETVIRRELPSLADVVFFVGMEDDLSGDARRRESVWCQILLNRERGSGENFRTVIDRLNQALPPALPGVSVSVINGGFDRMVSMSTDGRGYRVELSSESRSRLQSAADQMEKLLARDPDILDIRRDVTRDRKSVTAVMNSEELGSLGIDAGQAAMTARIAFEGVESGDYRPTEGPGMPIRIAGLQDGATPDSSTLAGISIRNSTGRLIPLDAVAEVREGVGASGIMRHNRARTLTLVAQTRDENVREIDRRLKAAMEGNPLEGVSWRIRGVSGLLGDSAAKLALVLGVALFLVYSVMAIQFERIVQPLIIMASVPFCFIGVVGGLAAFGSDISMVSFVGIVALAGIVVNNAIVQVDRINYLRKNGMDLKAAVISGSVGRLRPILMTTLTTFFGVLPLALARGGGARIYAPLGQAIAGGLLSSTLVTLFLVPVLYLLAESPGEKKAAHRNGGRLDI